MGEWSTQLNEWMDREVSDIDGHKIGSVGDIYYRGDTGKPEWVLIKTGLFGTKKSFAPAGEITGKGDKLTVPYAKEVVREAPRVEHQEELTEEEERGLYRYYGLEYSGQTEGAPTSQSDAPVQDRDILTVPRPCDLVRMGGDWKPQPLGFMVVAKEEILCEDEPAAEK